MFKSAPAALLFTPPLSRTSSILEKSVTTSSESREPDVRSRALDLDGLGGWRSQEVDDDIIDLDERTPESVFSGCVFDVSEDVYRDSRGDSRFVVVSRPERAKS